MTADKLRALRAQARKAHRRITDVHWARARWPIADELEAMIQALDTEVKLQEALEKVREVAKATGEQQ